MVENYNCPGMQKGRFKRSSSNTSNDQRRCTFSSIPQIAPSTQDCESSYKTANESDYANECITATFGASNRSCNSKCGSNSNNSNNINFNAYRSGIAPINDDTTNDNDNDFAYFSGISSKYGNDYSNTNCNNDDTDNGYGGNTDGGFAERCCKSKCANSNVIDSNCGAAQNYLNNCGNRNENRNENRNCNTNSNIGRNFKSFICVTGVNESNGYSDGCGSSSSANVRCGDYGNVPQPASTSYCSRCSRCNRCGQRPRLPDLPLHMRKALSFMTDMKQATAEPNSPTVSVQQLPMYTSSMPMPMAALPSPPSPLSMQSPFASLPSSPMNMQSPCTPPASLPQSPRTMQLPCTPPRSQSPMTMQSPCTPPASLPQSPRTMQLPCTPPRSQSPMAMQSPCTPPASLPPSPMSMSLPSSPCTSTPKPCPPVEMPCPPTRTPCPPAQTPCPPPPSPCATTSTPCPPRQTSCSSMSKRCPVSLPVPKSQLPSPTPQMSFRGPSVKSHTEPESPELAFKCRMRKLQMENLVKDLYCPGAIQSTIDGESDFNEMSFRLVFGCEPLPCEQPPAEPISLLEAFCMRVELERCLMNNSEPVYEEIQRRPSKNSRRASFEVDVSSVDDYFSRHYKTQLNLALADLLRAEKIFYTSNPPENTLTMDAAINKTCTGLPNVPIKITAFTGSTQPLDE